MPPPRRRRAGFRLKNIFRKLKIGRGYLQLMYYDPIKEANRPLPDGTPVSVIYHSALGIVLSVQTGLTVGGGKGKVSFFINKYADDEQHKYISIKIRFPDDERRYINLTTKKLMKESELTQAVTKDGQKYYTKNMLFSLPRDMGFGNAKWNINCNLYENAFKYFKVPYGKALKGDSGHAKLILRPEWQYLSFRFFKAFTNGKGFVPQGLLVEGFINDVKKVRSNLWKDKCQIIPWITGDDMASPPAGTTARNANHVKLEFATANAFVNSDKLLLDQDAAKIWKKPLKKRYEYFDLPARWVSTNWMVRIVNTRDEFKNLANRATTKAQPMRIYLDSVTLTDGALNSIAWNANNRFTIFDIKLEIQRPQTSRPYWYKNKFKTNCFLPHPDEKKPRRLIAFNGKFYDVTYNRSTTGSVIGARAAVENDPRVHYGETKISPVGNKAGFDAGHYTIWGEFGHFGLHYLIECLDDKDKEIPRLLIYWSSRFVKPKPPPPPNPNPQPHDSAKVALAAHNDADTNVFRKDGFTNAKERWEKKKYTFVPKQDPNKKKLTVYPYFFFEGREDTAAVGPNGWPPAPPAHLVNKPYKCTTLLHPGAGGRSDMSSFFANFMKDTHQPQPGHGSTNEDGTYARFTMAHELGHAIGLLDEYIESIPDDAQKYATNAGEFIWSPVLPFIKQWYPGMPYSCDGASMMQVNQAPRLRHFWYFCQWLNQTAAVKNLTGQTVFQVKGAWKAKKKKYKYFLKEDNSFNDNGQNFLLPYYSDRNFPGAAADKRKMYDKKYRAHAAHGHSDLLLFNMGEDETKEIIIPTKPGFDGILVVRLNIEFKFEKYENAADHTQDEDWPDDAAVTGAGDDKKMPEKLRYLRRFQTRVNARLNKRFYLTHKTDKLFRQVYVYFVPHYKFPGQEPTFASDFEITVQRNTTGAFRHSADFKANNFVATSFTIDQLQDPMSVMRYMLGLIPYKVKTVKKGGVKKKVKISLTDITANDLRFLARWVKKQRGNTFRHRVKAINKP